MTNDERVRTIILEIVEKIIKEYSPKKVILFGSYAYGEPTEDSDIDVLVVTERSLSPEATYKIRRQFLRDFAMPVQIVCVSNEEFVETKDVIGGITYPAAKHGEAVYEKS
jgi:predicted nucleotidyltransferase